MSYDRICDVDEKGRKISYCPFGCVPEQIDEYGYCDHLVGFTNDGSILEPVARLLRNDRNGVAFDTGMKRVSLQGRRHIHDEEVIVNPEFLQKQDNGVQALVKKWVSGRVYSPKIPGEKPITKTVHKAPDQERNEVLSKLDQLTGLLLSQANRLDALEQQLGITEPAKMPQMAEV